jgi:hypothetical protein
MMTKELLLVELRHRRVVVVLQRRRIARRSVTIGELPRSHGGVGPRQHGSGVKNHVTNGTWLLLLIGASLPKMQTLYAHSFTRNT